jgi:hypothetical protein
MAATVALAVRRQARAEEQERQREEDPSMIRFGRRRLAKKMQLHTDRISADSDRRSQAGYRLRRTVARQAGGGAVEFQTKKDSRFKTVSLFF